MMANQEEQDSMNKVSMALEDYGRLLSSGILSDVTLYVVSDEGVVNDFRAHKLILMARSPVFAEMFANEGHRDRVEIVGIDTETVGHLLSYIYTEKLPDSALLYSKVCKAAAKYGLTIDPKIKADPDEQVASFAEVIDDKMLTKAAHKNA